MLHGHPDDSFLLQPTRHTYRLRGGASPDPRDHNASRGWAAFRVDICGSELGAAQPACRPQSPLQHAMVLGHSASDPFLGADVHWWHGLPSVHLAHAAPLRAGFVTGNAGRWRVSPKLATHEEGWKASLLAASSFLDVGTQSWWL